MQKHARIEAIDPEKYYYVICAQIAAGANIPLSILMGTPRAHVNPHRKIARITRTSSYSGIPPSIFLIDVARGTLYEAQAETEKAKAERERAQARIIETQRKALTYEQNGEQSEEQGKEEKNGKDYIK